MRRILFGLLALAMVIGMTGLALAGPEHDHKAEEQAGSHEAEMMEVWAKLAIPGEHHAHMARSVGTWDFKGEFWMTPDSPTMESHGTAVVESILGDRFSAVDNTSCFRRARGTTDGLFGARGSLQKTEGC